MTGVYSTRDQNRLLLPRNCEGSGWLQRKCACQGIPSGQSECEDCKQKHLQRHAAGRAAPAYAPPIVHQALSSPGRPLDGTTRGFFEPRFGHDFSKVRVHSDHEAAESARAVSAQAYTVGHHVVFGAGEYQPGTEPGRRLIAHELTHVVQQGNGDGTRESLALGDPNDSYESDAERWSFSVMEMPAPKGPRPDELGGHGAIRRLSRSGIVQRAKIPTGISLKETHALGHSDLKNEADKKKFLTYIADVSLMQLTPAGDYTEGKEKRGECTKEFLTEVSNTCPARDKPFCESDKCFQVNQYKKPVGDANTGTLIPDGPDTFVDFHRAPYDTSLLEGSGKKQCSVVCHQLYKYRTEPDKKYYELGAFYIIRNFKADTYKPSDSKTPINITTGQIKKVAAGSNAAPSKEDFAKKVAPGLVKSGDLLDAPAAPAAPATSTTVTPKKGEQKK